LQTLLLLLMAAQLRSSAVLIARETQMVLQLLTAVVFVLVTGIRAWDASPRT